jgi:hypothetical protein
MKKLERLQIKTEKIMKTDELSLIRGGYDDVDYCVLSCSTDQDCGGRCPYCHETAGGWPKPICNMVG